MFAQRADAALQALNDALIRAAERYDCDSDFNAGTLTVSFDDPPARFVVSPNTPVHQLWVSANVKSYKLAWDDARGEFVLPATGQNLTQVTAAAMSALLGQSVEL